MEPIVIVAIIAAVASLGGAIIVGISARGKNRVDYKTALDARIDKRVADQLAEAWTQIDKQKGQISGLLEQNSRQARIERLMYRYLQTLRHHIEAGNPPPPPTMPAELFEWYADRPD